MEELAETETNVPKKNHFLKFHERIQLKYHELQKKLEKSKSFDSLSMASDDLSYKENMYSSNIDLRESDAVSYSEAEEHISITSAVRHDIAREVSFEENVNNDDDWERIETDVCTETRFSYESLNEVGKESDDSSSRPTPSPRTIKERIECRFQAAKEKRERKRVEKEKLLKEKPQKEKKDNREKVEKFILSNSIKDKALKINRKSKIATVTIALIDATYVEPTVEERMQVLQCRFRLGTEKFKSKLVKCKGLKVKWQELFNFSMYEDHTTLELNLWDKDASIGRAVIDLLDLEREKTHQLKIDVVENPIAKIFVLLTISGISFLNTVTEINDLENTQRQLKSRRKSWYRLETNLNNVGMLSVIVYGAKGLAAHDCYCVLKIANSRLQTHTEYKTNDPNWMKIFTFQLRDITSILEVSVFDEKKVEEIGKISIPLLRINNEAKVWYALKDHTQRERARGTNPRILLEMRTSWNLFKAAIHVINPKEVDLLAADAKFDRRIFARNIARAKAVTNWVLDSIKLMKTCFEWESRKSNVIALIAWTLFCYFFKVWMLPLLILIPFVRHRPEHYYLLNWRKLFFSSKGSALEQIKVEKEEKSTLRQKINSLQEMVQTVQNSIGKVASIGESIKNLCNFTVPFVSLLAVVIMLCISFVMYIIPLKYILIFWGFHKFTRKILRPNRIPNSEILDLISRVPDDETLLDCEELPLEYMSDDDVI